MPPPPLVFLTWSARSPRKPHEAFLRPPRPAAVALEDDDPVAFESVDDDDATIDVIDDVVVLVVTVIVTSTFLSLLMLREWKGTRRKHPILQSISDWLVHYSQHACMRMQNDLTFDTSFPRNFVSREAFTRMKPKV